MPAFLLVVFGPAEVAFDTLIFTGVIEATLYKKWVGAGASKRQLSSQAYASASLLKYSCSTFFLVGGATCF